MMQLKHITERPGGGGGGGGGGQQSLQPLGKFCDFAEETAILTPFQSHFARFWNHMNN